MALATLLNATICLKHQAALSVAYGAGLRVAEVASLKVSDVDSERMLLRVERGKGGQYRNAMLPADLLALLRRWWTLGREQGVMHRGGWLFPGQHAGKPVSTRHLHRIVVEAARAAEISKRVGPHTLRHSFATHLLEDGVDIRVIQALLGHAKLENTAFYTRVATCQLRRRPAPAHLLRRHSKKTAKRDLPSACALHRLWITDTHRAGYMRGDAGTAPRRRARSLFSCMLL